jgi:hypothetical protein
LCGERVGGEDLKRLPDVKFLLVGFTGQLRELEVSYDGAIEVTGLLEEGLLWDDFLQYALLGESLWKGSECLRLVLQGFYSIYKLI